MNNKNKFLSALLILSFSAGVLHAPISEAGFFDKYEKKLKKEKERYKKKKAKLKEKERAEKKAKQDEADAIEQESNEQRQMIKDNKTMPKSKSRRQSSAGTAMMAGVGSYGYSELVSNANKAGIDTTAFTLTGRFNGFFHTIASLDKNIRGSKRDNKMTPSVYGLSLLLDQVKSESTMVKSCRQFFIQETLSDPSLDSQKKQLARAEEFKKIKNKYYNAQYLGKEVIVKQAVLSTNTGLCVIKGGFQFFV